MEAQGAKFSALLRWGGGCMVGSELVADKGQERQVKEARAQKAPPVPLLPANRVPQA